MKRKHTILSAFCLIVIFLCAFCLVGCQGKDPAGDENPAGSAQETTTETPEQDHSHDISYADAFVSKNAPEGFATPDTIAFSYVDQDDNMVVENIAPSEVNAFVSAMEHPPRTYYFDKYIPEKLQSLFPILDYAMYYGYDKMCIPTTEFEGSNLFAVSKYLGLIYLVNDNSVTGRTVSSFENEAGEKVNYVYVSIMGMGRQQTEKYRTAIDEAKRIVATVPEDYNEYETAMYLYRYLTDHVEYNYFDYYKGTDWNLLYDALIKGSTVCAGYNEAMYVLFNLAGIECFPITGYVYDDYHSNDSTTRYNGGHGWNVAKLDGKYYEFDATWDAGRPMAEYLFFAVSTEDLMYYYPRRIDDYCENYCEPRTESLFERVNLEDDSMDYGLLQTAFFIVNEAHTNPLQLLISLGFDVTEEELMPLKNGWSLAPYAYDDFIDVIDDMMSVELAETFFHGYIKNEKGYICINTEKQGETYRFCRIEDEKAKVYRFDERGNFTRCDMAYRIGDDGVRYFLESLKEVHD
ncbi:MAG: hypothetical protein II930_07940 [Lachnospiraceae bacterium]|nr:hypothetical protein [Lachnospiraceae bacterium]